MMKHLFWTVWLHLTTTAYVPLFAKINTKGRLLGQSYNPKTHKVTAKRTQNKVSTIIYDSHYDLANENRYLNNVFKKNSHTTYFVKCNNTPYEMSSATMPCIHTTVTLHT